MKGKTITLYQGEPTSCGYFADRQATNIYADPHHDFPATVYDTLITQGFRRSGGFIYRPACHQCQACVPVRVIAGAYTLTRRDRRTLKTNDDVQVRCITGRYDDEYFDLYRRYLNGRHADGGMDNPEPEDFRRFLISPWGDTLFVEVRLNGDCIAIAVTDSTAAGLSAVYTFFDPELHRRSLGRFCILQQIELCNRIGLPHLYLGYWIEGCQKMDYKQAFRPQQHFNGQQWRDVD